MGLVTGGILAVVVIAAGVASGSKEKVPASTVAAITTTTLTPDAKALAEGNMAACKDGGYSSNGDFKNTCSSMGGVEKWLSRYGRCTDGAYIRMSTEASCEDNGGFDRLLQSGQAPESGPKDVALCKDGTFSENADFKETCSSKGGIDKWLSTYGRCEDGATIKMSPTATCRDNGGFDRVLPTDFKPKARSGDVALCKDGTYSDNTDFSATCGSHTGVAKWLSTYGTCTGGKVIKLAKSASCGSEDFQTLLPTTYVPPTTTTTAPPTTVFVPPATVYIPPTTVYVPPPTPAYVPPAPPSGCDPNYSGCVPIDSDVDCAGGSGNGPSYVQGPVTVIGSDIYDLDRKGNGIGCE